MFITFNKSREIYSYVIAHRGFHLGSPENTLAAYKMAVKMKYAIELDVRMLKDGTIVCIHDRYMKRLLGVPGDIERKTYDQIKKYKVQNSDQSVPTLSQTLELINGNVMVLIEVKGRFNIKYLNGLKNVLKDYSGNVYFHTKNLCTYFALNFVWDNKVFWVYDIFRKRFNFLKGRMYASMPIFPLLDDILVDAENDVGDIIKKLWSACNKYKTRVNQDHWLLSYNDKKCQIAHRAIADSTIKEHSKEAFETCVRKNKVIEFDIMLYKGKILVYHKDKISDRLGQAKSCAEKCFIKNAIEFKQVLEIVHGKVPIIIDIKDYRIVSRKLEDMIINELSNYIGEFTVQSFNPLVLKYFKDKKPEYIRGQIGNSLKGLRKTRKILLPIVNFFLFYYGEPDYIVYDLDKNVHTLSNFNNIVGLPVLAYAPKKESEILEYVDFFDNFIVEGDW